MIPTLLDYDTNTINDTILFVKFLEIIFVRFNFCCYLRTKFHKLGVAECSANGADKVKMTQKSVCC